MPSESSTAQVWPLRGWDPRSRETTFLLHVRSGWGEPPDRGREQSQEGSGGAQSCQLEVASVGLLFCGGRFNKDTAAARPPAQHRDVAQDPLLQTVKGTLSCASPASPPREGGLCPPRLLLGPTVSKAPPRHQGHCLTLGTDQTGRRACPAQPSTPKGPAAVCECV